jgi:hypothetical protein
VIDDEIRWHFGPGLWRYRLARRDIASARVVRNGWLSGFGVRIRPGFRLYNVSGLDAVELTAKERFSVGEHPCGRHISPR